MIYGIWYYYYYHIYSLYIVEVLPVPQKPMLVNCHFLSGNWIWLTERLTNYHNLELYRTQSHKQCNHLLLTKIIYKLNITTRTLIICPWTCRNLMICINGLFRKPKQIPGLSWYWEWYCDSGIEWIIYKPSEVLYAEYAGWCVSESNQH